MPTETAPRAKRPEILPATPGSEKLYPSTGMPARPMLRMGVVDRPWKFRDIVALLKWATLQVETR
jgi:hypothetical protein